MTVAIFGNNYQSPYLPAIIALCRTLRANGVTVMAEREFLDYLLQQCPDDFDVMPFAASDLTESHIDLALSLGGDGTFLRTVHFVGRKAPILGVNTGHLGYLSAVPIEGAVQAVMDFFAGKMVVRKRSLIALERAVGDVPELQPFALNEVAVTKEDSASMIAVSAQIDGQPLGTYLADGLIVSTPTGSTGYNLSVGGPILAPHADVWAITPVAAHMLTMRPLVVSDRSVLRLKVESRTGTYRLSLDGRSVVVDSQVELTLRRAPFEVGIVQAPDHSFAQTLREKLLWGETLSR